MEDQKNKYVAVSYKLYTNDENGRHLIEETKEGQPFSFISGFGFALDKFEQIITNTPQGEGFNFKLTTDEAYGDYHEDYVIDLDRSVFSIDGRFDGEHIYKDAIVPLQNEEGQRFNGRVVEVGNEKVKIDLNHPLAGEELYFEGSVLENRDATEAEISQLMKHLTGGCSGCGGNCGGNCGGDCGGNCGEGGCGV
jgi:FKBP-type peptidyl-prolyl cis-trans isomerase SlyD